MAELACDERDDELEDEGNVTLLDERRLDVVTELEVVTELDVATALDAPPFTTPNGAGCAAQVERDTQLLPFS